MSESFERAMTVRRAVLGDEYVDRVMSKDTPLNAPFQEFVTRWAWGEAWLDDTLDPQVRSLVTIALVASLGQIGEVLKHVAVYAGVALAVAALNAADEEIVAFTAANGSR